MKRVELTIPGTPVAFARAGSNHGRRFTPQKQSLYMDMVRLEASRVMGDAPLLEGPVRLTAQFVYEWPRSWPEKKKRTAGAHCKTSRPDADNLVKIIKDSLTSVVYRDDAQVYHVEAVKIYGTRDHVRVTIEEWGA